MLTFFKQASLAPRPVLADAQAARPVGRPSIFAALAPAMLVAACGGGGGGGGGGGDIPSSTTPPAVTNFPLQSAFRAYHLNGGDAQRYQLATLDYGDGSCSGTADIVIARPEDAKFEGLDSKAVNFSNAVNLTNCRYRINGTVGTRYYDAGNFGALGVDDNNGYGRYEPQSADSAPSATPLSVPLPAFVKAGDGGKLGRQYVYNNARLDLRVAFIDLDYSVTAESATTLLVNLVQRTTSATGKPFTTQIDTYRLGATGSLASVRRETIFYSTDLISLAPLDPAWRLVLTSPQPLR